MLKQFLFSSALILLLTSCNKNTVFSEVKIANRYTISVADYMQPCSDIQKDASLQYQNIEKDIYMIVIDEKKKMIQDYNLEYDIDTYFKNITSKGFSESISDGKISIPGRQEINGHKALIADVTGKVEKNEVYYKLALIETSYAFYQILIWANAQNKEKFESDMVTMIESFKELPISKSELPELKVRDSLSITSPVN